MRLLSFLLASALFLSLTATAKAEDLRSDVETFAARFGWPGAVALELDRTSIREAVAYGECRRGVPMTFDTPLMIGSVSKAFTAQAALTLAESGRLDLDTPIGAETVGLGGASRLVTARELLTHTSGFTSRQGMTIEREAQLASLTPAAARGPRRYSNLNYNLLGALIARRYGASFPDALKGLVADRFALDTVAVGSDMARACGHTLTFGAVVPRPEPEWPEFVAPSGFLQASARDLARLDWALLADARSGRGGRFDPLIGWKRATIGGHQVFSHSGQIGGARATVVLLPDQGRGLVIVVNRAGDLLQDPVDDLALRAVSRMLNIPEKPVPWPWERGLRLGALIVMTIAAIRLARAYGSRARQQTSWRTVVAAAAAAVVVPAAVLYVVGLTPAALWRLAPDLSLLIVVGPLLEAARWAVMRSHVANGVAPRPTFISAKLLKRRPK